MNSIPCEFYGGPMAGQTLAVPYPPPPVYKVPSYSRVRWNEANPAEMPIFETEEYELGPGRDSRYAYTWINPAASLRADIRRLHGVVEGLKAENSNLTDEREEYKDDALKWRALVGAIGPLLDEA